MMLFAKNCCDGAYKSYDVHFTKMCDNKCAFCVDKGSIEINKGKPDWRKIADSIIANQEGFDDVLILGGEPCLFLDELISLVDKLKEETNLKVYVTSSVPKTCFDDRYSFGYLLHKVDGFNISAQHYQEDIADKIRGTKSQYDRQAFYRSMIYKEKVRINLNIVRGYLDTKEELINCFKHYDAMGFNSIKLSEIQHSTKDYISFEEIFGVKFPSPYSGGCQSWVDTEQVFGEKLNTPILLKRSCFICESSLKASFMDGVKVMTKILNRKPLIDNSHYGVVYEDGSIARGWIKES